MTVRGLLLAGAILTSTPVESAALCHRYSIWHYPWAQRCGVGRQAQARAHVSREKTVIELPTDHAIPLPLLSIDDYGAGEPDEVTSARLMLLGYAYAH